VVALSARLLARDPARPPSKLAWAVEAPRGIWGVLELAAQWRRLDHRRRGDGRPVLLLPGLGNSDRSLLALRLYLDRLGYRAYATGLGRNRGPRTLGGTDAPLLHARLAAIHAETGHPVTLIGVSLGGIIARIMAHRYPHLVREVITISSPYAGPARATNVWRAYEWLSGEAIDTPLTHGLLAEAVPPPPVPTTAIWSRSDGLVNGLNCRGEGERAIEIRSSHLLVQLRAATLRAVAQVLANSGGRSP
jgi:triacylglycerol lipase